MTTRQAEHKQPTPEKPTKRPDSPTHLKTDKTGDKQKWDIIDEHAWESFPASDPPASWAGRDISPEERDADAATLADGSDEEPEAPKKKR